MNNVEDNATPGGSASSSPPSSDGPPAVDADSALDLVRKLAVTLNHEINNPLFVASATLEDILAESSDEELARRIHTALDAIWKVAEAVKQLQDLRRVVTTTYIPGFPMVDLKASSERLPE